jgi:hypothetical protein
MDRDPVAIRCRFSLPLILFKLDLLTHKKRREANLVKIYPKEGRMSVDVVPVWH